MKIGKYEIYYKGTKKNDKYEIYYKGAENDGKYKWFIEYVKFITPIIQENAEKFRK